MRNSVLIVCGMLLSFGLSSIGPWWLGIMTPMAAGIWYNGSAWKQFIVGFLILFVVWTVGLFSAGHSWGDLIGTRMAHLFWSGIGIPAVFHRRLHSRIGRRTSTIDWIFFIQ